MNKTMGMSKISVNNDVTTLDSNSKWNNIIPFIKRQEICKKLRECLMMKKDGIRLDKLNEEFKIFAGYDIPYEIFDCENLKTFLLKLKNIHMIKDDYEYETVIVSGQEYSYTPSIKHPNTRKRCINTINDINKKYAGGKRVCKELKNSKKSKIKGFSHSISTLNGIPSIEAIDKDDILNARSDFGFDKFCSMFPIFYNHQAMGDDCFVDISETYFGSLAAISNGVRTCGLCIEDQTIEKLVKKICNSKIIAPRVVIMIGNNDLLKQTPIQDMTEGLRKLVQILKQYGIKVTLCTLPKPPNFANQATIDKFNKYNFSIRSYATNPELKCHVIDIEYYFRCETKTFYYYCNNNIAREVKYFPSIDNSAILDILKKKLTRQYEIETKKFY